MSDTPQGKSLYIFLENGWGNMVLELMTGYAIKELMFPEKYEVVGLFNRETLYTHCTVYNPSHEHFGLPHPCNISKILPKLKFEDEKKLENYKMIYIHENNVDEINDRKTETLVIRVDWMNINFNLVIPMLPNIQNLDNFRPPPIISEYLNRTYPNILSREETIGLHLRVRQPGDILSIKLPTGKWYVDALKRFEPHKGKKLFIVSGISTGHLEAKDYLTEVSKEILSSFPGLGVYAIYDEPYYIDFFFLSHMRNLIVTHSTFSITAAILGIKWDITKRVLVPPHVLESNFGNEIFNIPGFEQVPGDDFVYNFR